MTSAEALPVPLGAADWLPGVLVETASAGVLVDVVSVVDVATASVVEVGTPVVDEDIASEVDERSISFASAVLVRASSSRVSSSRASSRKLSTSGTSLDEHAEAAATTRRSTQRIRDT